MAPDLPRPSPELEGAKKRRRTVLACNTCREKKRKCDGVKPLCSACQRRGIEECVWDEERINKIWNNRCIESLKVRIRELEARKTPSSPGTNNQYVPVGNLELPLHEDDSAGTAGVERGNNAEPLPENNRSAEATAFTTTNYTFPTWDELGISLPIHSAPSEEEDLDTAATDSEDDGVDAMGVISCLPNANCGRKRRPSNYLSPSSTKGLLDKARTAIDIDRTRNISYSDTSSASMADTAENESSRDALLNSIYPRTDGGVFGMTIPSRPEADTLVESYWTWTHSLYPFIHRPSFEERYKSIWYPCVQTGHENHNCSLPKRNLYADTSDRLFYTMLNMIFALGAHFSPNTDPKNRVYVSHSFYERGKKLIDIELLANGVLALVQTLLLTGQYLQSTEMSNSCWNIVGLAVRVAQSIGLHHDPKNCDQGCCSSQSFDQIELEMRRRNWAGCVMLDRVLSLTHGRPLMVHSAMTQGHLVFPSDIDDEYLTSQPDAPGSQPERVPSLVHCFIQAIQLQEILGHVLTSFYYGDVSTKRSDHNLSDTYPGSTKGLGKSGGIGGAELQRIFNVEAHLVSWHHKLPPHLKIETYNDALYHTHVNSARQRLYKRQAMALECRFHHVRLMMLRPVLLINSDFDSQPPAAAMCPPPINSDIESDMLIKARAMCLNIAQILLRVIETNMNAQNNSLPPPWYTVFYIHTCAVVSLTALISSPSRVTHYEQQDLVSVVNRCLAALRHYRKESRTARRCIRSLTSIMTNILQRNFGGKYRGQTIRSSIGNGLGSVEGRDEGENGGTGESLSGLPGTGEEDIFSTRALFNDDGFHQYVWMSDLSLFANDSLGEMRF